MKLESFPLSLLVGAVCVAGFWLPATGRAQSGGQFDLTWSIVANGGGISSGGQFKMSGTVGQPGAGTLSGGNFKLEGGFWSGITLVQTPGAPLLKIKPVGGGMVLLSWPLSAQGFTLEESSAVGSNNWSKAPQLVVDTATEHTVTVLATGVIKCYRLKK